MSQRIDSGVSESCELISVIQECMVDLESALKAQESQGKNQQSNSLESAGTAQGHLLSVHTHAKLPKLELKKFHANPIEWYPFGNLSNQQFIRIQTCLEWINSTI